jgi:hypothetical protein
MIHGFGKEAMIAIPLLRALMGEAERNEEEIGAFHLLKQ